MQLVDARTGRPLDPARGPRRDTRGRLVPDQAAADSGRPGVSRSSSSKDFFTGVSASVESTGGLASERLSSEEDWRETRQQQREEQRLATLVQQGRSVVEEAPGAVAPEALPRSIQAPPPEAALPRAPPSKDHDAPDDGAALRRPVGGPPQSLSGSPTNSPAKAGEYGSSRWRPTGISCQVAGSKRTQRSSSTTASQMARAAGGGTSEIGRDGALSR